MPLWRHLLSILALPFSVIVVVPAYLVRRGAEIEPGWSLLDFAAWVPAVAGIGLIGAGLWLMVQTNALFHRIGKGTLAPWDPPRHFVAQGVYRRVRNPMISGVLLILLGEATLLRSQAVFSWFLVFLAMCAVYIPLLEERDLARRFGEDYLRYKRNVPRWIPRLRPWTDAEAEAQRPR